MPVPKEMQQPTTEVDWNTGVYLWENMVNGKVYVGGAYRDFLTRLRAHEYALIRGDHYNKHLQRAWNKYGGENFKVRIIEICSPDKVLEREQFWIDEMNAADGRYGYNSSPTAGSSLGVKQSEETLEKNRNKSEETKAKLRAAMLGRKHTEETKKKMKETNKGKGRAVGTKMPEKHRAKLSAFYKDLAAKRRRYWRGIERKTKVGRVQGQVVCC